jgi:hypothetical protein
LTTWVASAVGFEGSGDWDNDSDLDACDIASWVGCLTGPDSTILEQQCLIGDLEKDGDVDLVDFAGVQRAFRPIVEPEPKPIRVRSSGAAQPGDTVWLHLAEELPGNRETTAVWTQSAGPSVGPILHTGNGSARFTAPGPDAVPMTVDAAFEVKVPGDCSAAPRFGAVMVAFQVADLTLDLPATVALHVELSLKEFVSIEGAPPEFVVLYSVQEPLPPGVDLDLDPVTRSLIFFSGVGSVIEVQAQVFGAAGLLATAVDELVIVSDEP